MWSWGLFVLPRVQCMHPLRRLHIFLPPSLVLVLGLLPGNVFALWMERMQLLSELSAVAPTFSPTNLSALKATIMQSVI